ncbi:MAG: alpha/beta hydrolase [Gammaproteobacteria bacterium]|nr:alpha/beta hydrolase [Gammaproteobacteria bacterium]
MTRLNILLILLVNFFCGSLIAQEEPLIWLDMTQSELDAAYDQAVYAPNLEQVLSRQTVNSHIARETLGPPQRWKYGPGGNDGVDIYTTDNLKAPIHLFVHGGTWRFGSAANNAFPSELFVNAGAHFVVADFDSVADHDGDLFVLVRQLREAVSWLYLNAESFGGDRDRIFLSGFSSGAHLASVLVTTDWQQYGVPDNVIKGALLSSGMYDLVPVSLSSRREYVSLNEKNIPLLSPSMQLDRISAPLIVAVGTRETPEFQRQARDFVKVLKDNGKDATLLVAREYNHFEIIETLANPYGILGRAVLLQMRISMPAVPSQHSGPTF